MILVDANLLVYAHVSSFQQLIVKLHRPDLHSDILSRESIQKRTHHGGAEATE